MVTTTVALGVTLAVLVGFSAIGLWAARGGPNTAEALISARNSTGPRRTTATLVASVMGVWILLAAPEAGASFGIAAVIGYAIGEALPMAAYATLGPRIRTVIPEGHSLTEYAHVRYGTAMYLFVLLVSGLYMFVFVAAELTGIASALSLVADVPQYQTAILVGGFVLLYTSYGGLRASIVTDSVQALFVGPLLVATLIGAVLALGGPGEIVSSVQTTQPQLLDPGFWPGLQFGIALAFAILGAELINQTWWQRIYAARDDETVRSSFHRATVLNGVIVFVAALFGILAIAGADIVTDPTSSAYNADIALFVLLESAFPEWITLAVVLLALVLVMSSTDSLFNALASVVTADLPRVLDDPNDRTLRIGARLLTIGVALAAIYVSLRARSVLRLFFLADLLGAAMAVPLLYGLYSRGLSGRGALVASLCGLAVGLVFFPDFAGLVRSIPGLGAVLPAPDQLYLRAFGGAFLTSSLMTAVAARVGSATFDHDELATEIRRLDDPATDGGER
ncbi:MAG: sodium:proline symporter [Halococcoides sp.]